MGETKGGTPTLHSGFIALFLAVSDLSPQRFPYQVRKGEKQQSRHSRLFSNM